MLSEDELIKLNGKTCIVHFMGGRTEKGIFHCYSELDDETEDVYVEFGVNSFFARANGIESIEVVK